MRIIYPSDPSTKFLKEIVTCLTSVIACEINYALPDDYHKTLDFINSTNDSETIVFLGHGFSGGLYGGCYVVDGRKILLNKESAKNLLKNKKVILFSCRSSEFISEIEGVLTVALGFGNIKTGIEDLSAKEKKKYRDSTSIRIFRENLTTLFANAFVESIKLNYSFVQLNNAINLRINKCICNFSLSHDSNERLAGELMFELKKEMLIFGDGNSKLI